MCVFSTIIANFAANVHIHSLSLRQIISTIDSMKRKILSLLCLLAVTVSTPAFALFEKLDSLESELNAIEETGSDAGSARQDSGLSNLLQQLEQETTTTTTRSGTPTFYDVPNDAWFYTYVREAASRGIVSGYKDNNGYLSGYYGPGDPVTVAQMLKIAMEAADTDLDNCSGTPYTLSARGHWAQRYVVCAEQRSMRIIVPNMNIDRAALRGEVLGIVHDVYGDQIQPMASDFTDTHGHPYERDIAYAASQGIVSGDTDTGGRLTGTYRPNDGVNRAEAAKIIYEKLTK